MSEYFESHEYFNFTTGVTYGIGNTQTAKLWSQQSFLLVVLSHLFHRTGFPTVGVQRALQAPLLLLLNGSMFEVFNGVSDKSRHLQEAGKKGAPPFPILHCYEWRQGLHAT